MSECSTPEIGSLLHAYEVNALPEEDLKQFEIHLLSCEHCFVEIQDFENIAAILREDEEMKNLVRT